MANESDASDLLAWGSQGNEAALTRLVERHARMVATVCRRELGDGAAADEATQAVFIILARRAAQISDPQRVGSWLFGVALRVCRTTRRTIARRTRHEQEAAMRLAANQAPDTKGESAWSDIRPHLNAAIASLSEAQRAIVIDHYLDGVPQTALAARLGISEDAAHQRVHYALGKLRAWFAQRGLTVGAGALSVGLASEGAAVESSVVATCTQAAAHPSAVPGAAKLASAAIATTWSTLILLCAAPLLVIAVAAGGWWWHERTVGTAGSGAEHLSDDERAEIIAVWRKYHDRLEAVLAVRDVLRGGWPLRPDEVAVLAPWFDGKTPNAEQLARFGRYYDSQSVRPEGTVIVVADKLFSPLVEERTQQLTWAIPLGDGWSVTLNEGLLPYPVGLLRGAPPPEEPLAILPVEPATDVLWAAIEDHRQQIQAIMDLDNDPTTWRAKQKNNAESKTYSWRSRDRSARLMADPEQMTTADLELLRPWFAGQQPTIEQVRGLGMRYPRRAPIRAVMVPAETETGRIIPPGAGYDGVHEQIGQAAWEMDLGGGWSIACIRYSELLGYVGLYLHAQPRPPFLSTDQQVKAWYRHREAIAAIDQIENRLRTNPALLTEAERATLRSLFAGQTPTLEQLRNFGVQHERPAPKGMFLWYLDGFESDEVRQHTHVSRSRTSGGSRQCIDWSFDCGDGWSLAIIDGFKSTGDNVGPDEKSHTVGLVLTASLKPAVPEQQQPRVEDGHDDPAPLPEQRNQ